MPGSSVVPGIRTLLCRAAQHFIDLYFQKGIKFFQKHGKRGTHDARSDKNNIGMICGWHIRYVVGLDFEYTVFFVENG